jgi:hypothetical protein
LENENLQQLSGLTTILCTKKGFTTKKEGSGLGLSYASDTIKKWGGTVEINSSTNKGTTVTLELPTQDPPNWFIDNLAIKNQTIIVCVDDSRSVGAVWNERMRENKGILSIIYCSSKKELIKSLPNLIDKECLFLIDHEFSGKSYSGEDIIEIIINLKKPNFKPILVTSRSSDSTIKNFCIDHNIKMISKIFIPKIPINIID